MYMYMYINVADPPHGKLRSIAEEHLHQYLMTMTVRTWYLSILSIGPCKSGCPFAADLMGNIISLHGDMGIDMKCTLVEWSMAVDVSGMYAVALLITTVSSNYGILSMHSHFVIRDGVIRFKVEYFMEINHIG